MDTLVTETTRGLSERDPACQRESEIVNLLDQSRKALAKSGSVLIPVFALGRMQEMLVVLDEAIKCGALPKVPVFCSGLGMDLVNHFHEISKNTNRIRFNRKVLKSLGARPLPRKLEPGREPPVQGIYLVSSGMLVEHTPSYVMASSMLGTIETVYFLWVIVTPIHPAENLSKPNMALLSNSKLLTILKQ